MRQHKKLRIVFQTRPDAFCRPGGDTVLLVKLKESLERLGHQVYVALNPRQNLEEFDFVHCFNICLPNMIEHCVMNANSQKKEMFIHPLQEDVPRYRMQSFTLQKVFREYMDKGQPDGFLDDALEEIRNVEKADMVTSIPALRYASTVFTSGNTESEYIKSIFPDSQVCLAKYGADNCNDAAIGDSLFRKAYGLNEDFVLCVGRLETRKNQLMLLAALEGEDVTLVFVDSGFSYQQDYVSLCKNFKRKGRTIFTGHLSEEVLISAYKAAKVHCLPSWYELPGLVNLEAAWHGCNIVSTSWGTQRDYLGNNYWGCEPDNIYSIRNAVSIALEAPRDCSASFAVRRYTWKKSASAVLQSYIKTLNGNREDKSARRFSCVCNPIELSGRYSGTSDQTTENQSADTSLLDIYFRSTAFLLKENQTLRDAHENTLKLYDDLEKEYGKTVEEFRKATLYVRELEKDWDIKCGEIVSLSGCLEQERRELEAARRLIMDLETERRERLLATRLRKWLRRRFSVRVAVQKMPTLLIRKRHQVPFISRQKEGPGQA